MAVLFVIGVFLGFISGLSYKKAGLSKEDYATLQAKNAELSKQIYEAKKLFPQISVLKNVFGQVLSTNGNVLTIKTAPSNNPFEKLPESREVVVTERTKIVKRMSKDIVQYLKETEEYSQKAQLARKSSNPDTSYLIPPDTFIESPVKLSDIKVTDHISVDSENNIKTLFRFEAVKIIVNSFSQLNETPAAAPIITSAREPEPLAAAPTSVS